MDNLNSSIEMPIDPGRLINNKIVESNEITLTMTFRLVKLPAAVL
jgi:hypothetical protein